MDVIEWKNGTALYYWFNHPFFGMNDFLKFLLTPILISPVVTILTWSVILLEIFLAFGFVLEKKYWKTLLYLGLFFHFSIVIIHGLGSFFCAMAGLLILYLRPLNRPFVFNEIKLSNN